MGQLSATAARSREDTGSAELAAMRYFEDGVAVLDPVTWQTHILSQSGMVLLNDMVSEVAGCAADPSRLCARFLSDIPGAAADPIAVLRLQSWAVLACHLVAGSAAMTDR